MMPGHKWWRFCQLTGLLALSLFSHAQSNSWTTRIQVLPQVVPSPEKIIKQEPTPQSSSWGTGFVVAPGYLLTAYHVSAQVLSRLLIVLAISGSVFIA